MKQNPCNIDLSTAKLASASKITLPFFNDVSFAIMPGSSVSEALVGVHMVLDMCQSLAATTAEDCSGNDASSAEYNAHLLNVLLGLCNGVVASMTRWQDTSFDHATVNAGEEQGEA